VIEMTKLDELKAKCDLCDLEHKIRSQTIAKIEKTIDEKFILDACCGGRLFWFDKHQKNTIYIDNRIREPGHDSNRPNHCIIPDKVMDFRKLEFEDKTFKLIVFDPPHLISKPDSCRMVKQYGWLNKDTWRDDIKKGFDECWRVLEDYGVLVFKWNESSVKRKDVLEVIGRQPLFGHPNGSKIGTHWFTFMKIPEHIKSEISKLKEELK
jgi:hypothetical protein